MAPNRISRPNEARRRTNLAMAGSSSWVWPPRGEGTDGSAHRPVPGPYLAFGCCQRATEYESIRGTSMANSSSKALNRASSLPGVWS
jgi:hypothetical protein